MGDDYEPTPIGNRIVTPPPEYKYVCDVPGCGFSSKLDDIDPVYVVVTKTATLVSCPACIARWLAKTFPKLRAVPIARKAETKFEASRALEPLPDQRHVDTAKWAHRQRLPGSTRRGTPRTFKPHPRPPVDPDDPFPDA